MDQVDRAREIMMQFAGSTGVSPISDSPGRYLWTDAFAVCNFLGLYQSTGDKLYRSLASQLVDQVHSVLGRYRPDDTRNGWLSGLGESEAVLHPTVGGLRIGKQLKERRATEPLDERLEWERDGQYFHYLTKWMHALSRMAKCTGEKKYTQWAVELARTVHRRFVYSPVSGRPKRMYWKMSTDLSYPLVQSMGLHDPLDGLITYHELVANQAAVGNGSLELDAEISDMIEMCKGRNWVTDDTLGIGGLLSDAFRVVQLIAVGRSSLSEVLSPILQAVLTGLELVEVTKQIAGSPDYRLPFREFGLSIGLHAVPRLSSLVDLHSSLFASTPGLKKTITGLQSYQHLAERIEDFWGAPDRRGETWMAHQDINMVMWATSLLPDGFLTL